MVFLERLEDVAEIDQVHDMVRRHAEYTGSQKARRVLAGWDQIVGKFVKVMPKDYKRVLEAFDSVKAQGVSDEEAYMIAFDINKMDLARVGGN
jgi:glutamate synthase (ferredoxin)